MGRCVVMSDTPNSVQDIADALNRKTHAGSFAAEDAIDALERYAELLPAVDALKEALRDMLSGWRYIREVHGDLPGVGWDRAQNKAEEALR